MKALIFAAALAVSACTTVPAIPVEAPAPLAKTVIDDKALQASWSAFDIALDGINKLIDLKVIKVGSPKAIAVANGVDRATNALRAAESAVAAGSTTSYAVAMAEARAAFASLRLVLKGN